MSNAKMSQLIQVLANEFNFDYESALKIVEEKNADLFSKKFFDKKLVEKPISVFTNKVAEDKYNEFKISYDLPDISKIIRTGGKNNKQISKDDVQKAMENYTGFDINILLSEKGKLTVQELKIDLLVLKKEYLKGTFKKTANGFLNVTSIKSWYKKVSVEDKPEEEEEHTSDCEESEDSEMDCEESEEQPKKDSKKKNNKK